MTPNKENLRKWVEALRSGRYRQAHGALRAWANDDDAEQVEEEGYHYCCLGVACDLAGMSEEANGWQYGTLPPQVQEWLGIEENNPKLAPSPYAASGRLSASELNDIYGWTFDQIADAIEKRYGL